MNIPETLRLALQSELASLPPHNLTEATTRLSQRYRGGRETRANSRLVHSTLDSAAYTAFRLPATFAAIVAALAAARQRRPAWQPRTLLDAGAGPGTGMWAALAVWPQLERATLLERERAMIELGQRLAGHSTDAVLRAATWKQCDLLGQWEQEAHDLTIMAYALGEIPSERRSEIVARLWLQTNGTLVIVEPGTPVGFAVIRKARQELLAAGARMLAPCPHEQSCPMPENDWCHFSQRVARTPLHRHVKQAELAYEDEKFSYVAFSREPGSPIAGRVIRHPQVRSGHIYLDLCTPGGLQRTIVTRKEGEAFREARDLHWGDALS